MRVTGPRHTPVDTVVRKKKSPVFFCQAFANDRSSQSRLTEVSNGEENLTVCLQLGETRGALEVSWLCARATVDDHAPSPKLTVAIGLLQPAFPIPYREVESVPPCDLVPLFPAS